MKEVIVAKSAGFCWGVRRAFDRIMQIASESTKGHDIYTYGPLIHNPQTVSMLKSKGIKVLDSIQDSIDGTVVIRTHGISPDDLKKLRESGARVQNLTCPDVGRIQGLVKRYEKQNYGIIIIGDEAHPEVRALLGYAGENGRCVISVDDVNDLPNWKKVCVVSQSTQPKACFLSLVDAIKQRFSDAIIFDTICHSTEERQEETRDLASSVDAMVVVGGRNSANTKRLAEICIKGDTPTFLIETSSELDPLKLKPYPRIGVTAGASTPNWIIDEVVMFLRSVA